MLPHPATHRHSAIDLKTIDRNKQQREDCKQTAERGRQGRLQLCKTDARNPSPMDRQYIYKNIYIKKKQHLPPTLRPRAAISCNNGGREQRKKRSTRGLDSHHRATRWRRGSRGRGAKSKTPQSQLSEGGKIQSQPICVARNCVRGRARGLAPAANCHGCEREPTHDAFVFGPHVNDAKQNG